MNKTVCIAAAMSATLLLSACSMYAPVNLLAVPSDVAQPSGQTLERASAANAATESTGIGEAPRQAPLCSISLSCQALDAVQYPLDCVKKVPYTNVLVPIGTQFEVVDPSGDFKCADTGTVVNGKEVLTCYGRQLYSFELSLTNPSCNGGNSLDTATGQCQDGYGYDTAKKCCSPLPSGPDGSIAVRVNLGACPVPNP